MRPSSLRPHPSSLAAAAQQPLPLSGDAGDPATLRAVFQASGLPAQGYTFERAMRIPHIRISLQNCTLAALRARTNRTR